MPPPGELKYPQWVSMARDARGVRPAIIIVYEHAEHGLCSLVPVFDDEELARHPPDEMTSLPNRQRELEAHPLHDLWDACLIAERVEASSGRPSAFAWSCAEDSSAQFVHGSVIKEAAAQDMENELDVHDAPVSVLRELAWGDRELTGDRRFFESGSGSHVYRCGRVWIELAVTEGEPGKAEREERLAVISRTSLPVSPEDLDAVHAAFYDGRPPAPEGPFQLTEDGRVVGFLRRIAYLKGV